MKVPGIIVVIILASMCRSTSGLNAQDNNLPAGCYLKATINGAAWEASKMVLDKYPSEILQIWGDKGNTSLRLQINKPAKNKIDQMIKTDLNSWTDEKFNMYMLESGEVQVAKMDDKWVEGSFHMTLKDSRSGKQATVTSGSFRVPNPGELKK